MYILLFIFAGFISAFTIKMDYLPYISDKTILVSTYCEGLPASQMKELITIPEEDFLSSLKGIKNISSVTRDSLSFIKIELHTKTDINSALLETRQIIDQSYQQLPEKSQKPVSEIFSTNKNYLMTLAVIPPKSKLSEARYTVEKHIKQDLSRIKGCGKIQISGGLKDQITVETDTNLLNSKGLTINELADSIINTNIEYPAGTIKDENNEYILKTSNLFSSQEEILDTQVISGDSIFTLSDFAKIKKEHQKKESFCMLNSEEIIEIEISKKSEESPVSLSKNIKKYIQTLKEKYPDYNFKIIDDTSTEIKNSIFLVYLSALVGTFICFTILFLFYHKIEIALAVSSTIPLCILFSITMLKILGKNINLFSLTGISISLGMIVDPSIILIQKIIQQNKSKIKTFHKKSSQSNTTFENQIYISSIQTFKSNFSSSLTTIIVFFPFFLLPGILGELFSDLSIAIISSILFSFILSLTYIPAITKLFLKNSIPSAIPPKLISSIKNKYKTIISKYISNTKLVTKILLSSLITVILISILIKKEIIPNTASKTFNFTIEYPSNNSITKIQNETENLNKNLSSQFPQTTIYSKGGIDSENYQLLSDYKTTENSVSYLIQNINKKQQKQLKTFLSSNGINFHIEEKQHIISRILNLQSSFLLQPITEKFHQSNFSENSNIAINQCTSKSSIQQNPFSCLTLPDIKPDYKTNEYSFTPDTNKCSYYHIPKYYISYYSYQLINGLDAGELLLNGTYIPIKIKSTNPTSENLSIFYNNFSVPLSALGTFSINESEKILFRYNKKDSKEVPETTQNISGFQIIETEKEQFTELISNTALLLFIVLILLYCFLGSQFESYTMPFILLLTIFPAAAGAFIFLFITNQSLNINSILSLVVLFGTCVNNSIIFYEAILYEKQKLSIIEICTNELTGILLTTVTSTAALLPFTIDPFHINTQISTSIALCGGLLTSMLITIFIYPIIYSSLKVKK